MPFMALQYLRPFNLFLSDAISSAKAADTGPFSEVDIDGVFCIADFISNLCSTLYRPAPDTVYWSCELRYTNITKTTFKTNSFTMTMLGKSLMAWRTKRGLSQTELARLANISRPRISQIETGEGGKVQGATIHKLAAALGIAEADLIGHGMVVSQHQPTPSEKDESETIRQLRRQNAEQAIVIERLWERIDEYEGQLGKLPASSDAADTHLAPMWVAA